VQTGLTGHGRLIKCARLKVARKLEGQLMQALCQSGLFST